ncbi:MAG: ComEC/Rec2 family competence protein, partial [Clostridia bacterium]|nr:ComEC/Rec2 family competence protein [Clostridia bacterium]
MNRPMAMIGFSFFITLIAVGLLGYIVAFWAFAVLAAVLVIALIIRRCRLSTKFIALMTSVIVACAFFCTYTSLVYKRVIAYSGKTLSLTLEITDIEGEQNGTYRYTARVVGSEHKELNGAKIGLLSSMPITADVCDYVTATITPDIAGSSLLSSQLYHKSSGIFLKAHILEAYEVEKNPDKSVGYYFYSVRRAISEIISANLAEDSAGVVSSIFLGDTSGLDYKDSMNFRDIGISHIFCVSGLHVTLVSAIIYRFLSSVIERKRLLYGVTILAVWSFVAVTGFSYSSIRSGVMLSICYLGRMIWRDSDSLNSLGCAALVVCLINPYSATNISFLYSFFATLAMLIMPRPQIRVRSRALRSVIDTAVMSVNVALMTLPIQIFFFGTATLISPLSNCLIFFVVPTLMCCTMLAVILSLFTSILSAGFFLVCSVIAKYLLMISRFVSDFPYTTISADEGFIKPFIIIVVVSAAVLSYMKVGRRRIAVAAAAYCVMLIAGTLCYGLVFKPVMTVNVVDSGSATSVVVTQGDSAVVIGCGGRNYTANDVASLLKQKSMGEIDLLLLPSKKRADIVNLDGLS